MDKQTEETLARIMKLVEEKQASGAMDEVIRQDTEREENERIAKEKREKERTEMEDFEKKKNGPGFQVEWELKNDN